MGYYDDKFIGGLILRVVALGVGIGLIVSAIIGGVLYLIFG